MQCYKHPKEETGLSCGKCERPICTKCMVNGPAGVRCRECASLKGSSLYKIAPGRLAWATIVALVLGVGGAIIYEIGFFIFFIAPLYGGFVADMVIRAAGRKRGKVLDALAVGSIALGGIAAIAPRVIAVLFVDPHAAASAAGSAGASMLAGSLGFGIVWPLVGVALALSACIARLRHI